MSKNKSERDTISEAAYNNLMTFTSTLPEGDSPGDSEEDAGAEFVMGLNYMPGERDEIGYSHGNPKSKVKKSRKGNKVPDSAKVISADPPEPWMDEDTPSDTH